MKGTLSRRTLIQGAAAAAVATAIPGAAQEKRAKPLIYAHRGASALRPEHTLAAYAKAIEDGADLIEPDLVATKDGVLVARHENSIGETTDVASRPEFAARKTSKTVYGRTQEGWFTEDFTLAELKTLRTVERMKGGRVESHGFDGQFQILSLDEIIDFLAGEAAASGRLIGLAPELKGSSYFAGIGLALEPRLIDRLARHPYAQRAPVHVQSFETANLRALRKRYERGGNVRLVQLVVNSNARPPDVEAAGGSTTYADMCSAAGLRALASYADVVAPYLRDIIALDAQGRLGAQSTLVADAHAAGLQVVPWTFAPENRFLAADFRSADGDLARNAEGSIAEMRRYIATGIDGFFTDDPALGKRAIETAS